MCFPSPNSAELQFPIALRDFQRASFRPREFSASRAFFPRRLYHPSRAPQIPPGRGFESGRDLRRWNLCVGERRRLSIFRSPRALLVPLGCYDELLCCPTPRARHRAVAFAPAGFPVSREKGIRRAHRLPRIIRFECDGRGRGIARAAFG